MTRAFDTRAGTISLAIPKLRTGSYFPDWLLEPRRRAERALVAVVAQCYLEGVSTRRVEYIGADMARLRHSAPPTLPPPEPWALSQRGPRELVEDRVQESWLSVWEARRLLDWLDCLAPLLAAPTEVFVHGDLQMANVLVPWRGLPSRHRR